MKSTSFAYAAYKFENKSNDDEDIEYNKNINIISRPRYNKKLMEMR